MNDQDYANLEAASYEYDNAISDLEGLLETIDELRQTVDYVSATVSEGDRYYDEANFDSGSFDGETTFDSDILWDARCEVESWISDLNNRVSRVESEMDTDDDYNEDDCE